MGTPVLGHVSAIVGRDGGGLLSNSFIDAIAGSPAHTKGAWSSLNENNKGLPVDCHGFTLVLDGNQLDIAMMFDIGIGEPSSQKVILSNIPVIASDDFSAARGSFCPFSIPKGKKIWIRCQSSTASVTGIGGISPLTKMGYATPVHKLAFTFGADVTASRGLQLDPGGTANTWTAWTKLNSEFASGNAPINLKSAIILVNRNNTALTDGNYLLQFSYGTSQAVLIYGVAGSYENGSDEISPHAVGPFPFQCPKGQPIYVRMMSTVTIAGDRVLGMVLVGYG